MLIISACVIPTAADINDQWSDLQMIITFVVGWLPVSEWASFDSGHALRPLRLIISRTKRSSFYNAERSMISPTQGDGVVGWSLRCCADQCVVGIRTVQWSSVTKNECRDDRFLLSCWLALNTDHLGLRHTHSGGHEWSMKRLANDHLFRISIPWYRTYPGVGGTAVIVVGYFEGVPVCYVNITRNTLVTAFRWIQAQTQPGITNT